MCHLIELASANDKFFRGVFLISVKETLVMFILTSGKRDLSPFEGCICRPSLHNKAVAIRRLLQMRPNLEAAPHGPWPSISQNALKPDFFFFLCYSSGGIHAGESNAALHCLARVLIFSHVMHSIGNISKLLFLQVDSSDQVKKQT